MKFSLKILFVVVFLAAALCAAFEYAPTPALSVVLLGSLPLLILTATQLNSRWRRTLFLLVLGPFAAYAFFVGIMFGPWAAITVAPEELGFTKFRSTTMLDSLNWFYDHAVIDPWLILDPEFESTLSAAAHERLTTYQGDWMSLTHTELK